VSDERHGVQDVIIRTDLRPGDMGRLIALHGQLYAREYGWDTTFEGYVAESLAEMVVGPSPERHRLWIVEAQGEIVGSVGIVGREREEAQLRWLLLAPAFRGLGLGRQLLALALDFCRARHYRSVYLWTVSDLTAASSLYRSAGFERTEAVTRRIWGSAVTEERYDLRF
jgi:ribosomal protein S18 acetylase RimI-like enzyme